MFIVSRRDDSRPVSEIRQLSNNGYVVLGEEFHRDRTQFDSAFVLLTGTLVGTRIHAGGPIRFSASNSFCLIALAMTQGPRESLAHHLHYTRLE